MLIYALGALLLGAQLMTIGFLAELVIAYHGRHDDVYSVAEATFPADEMKPKEETDPPR